MSESICNSEHLYIAMKICAIAHKDQVDKAGNPYILHPLRVAAAGSHQSLDCAILGLLHDIVEDDGETFPLDWFEDKFPEIIITALNAITKKDGETINSYLFRVSRNRLASIVKEMDIADNSDPNRLAKLDVKTRNRLLKKYNKCIRILYSLFEKYRWKI